MAFSEEQFREIRREVGGFCDLRVPLHVRDQVRLLYKIDGLSVIIVESRPGYRDPSQWTDLDVAKLRYVIASNEWRLHWKRANGKWWRYDPLTRSTRLDALVREIDADEYGCFFG